MASATRSANDAIWEVSARGVPGWTICAHAGAPECSGLAIVRRPVLLVWSDSGAGRPPVPGLAGMEASS